MSRWFRVYDDLVDDPKVQRLPAALFKHLINVWCIASRSGGTLPTIDGLCFQLRLSKDKTLKILADLQSYDLIDGDGMGGIEPHNWHVRQFTSDNSTARVRAHREREREKERLMQKRNNGVS